MMLDGVIPAWLAKMYEQRGRGNNRVRAADSIMVSKAQGQESRHWVTAAHLQG